MFLSKSGKQILYNSFLFQKLLKRGTQLVGKLTHLWTFLRRQFAHSTYYGPTDGVYTDIQPSRELPAYYGLDWLPEGYDLRSRHMTNEDGSVVYGSDANEIELQYYFATKATHVYVSNDGCEVRYVSVHDGGADLYLAFAEGQSNKLVWYSEDRSVIFVLTAPCGEETLIRMAESVRSSKDEKAVLRYDLGWLPETKFEDGIRATIRRKLGADINASCGQLRRAEQKAAEVTAETVSDEV